METELNGLIDRIKREGVEKAQKDADKVVNDAREKADEIIKAALEEKANIIKNGRMEAEDFKKASEEAVKQAARDVILSLKERVAGLFMKVVKDKISDELEPDVLKEAILAAVKNFSKEGAPDIEILVSKKDRERLQKFLFSALSKDLKERLTLTGSPGIEKGFRIGEKGKDSYFDFTGEALAESFARYLNPRLREMLNA